MVGYENCSNPSKFLSYAIDKSFLIRISLSSQCITHFKQKKNLCALKQKKKKNLPIKAKE